MEQERLRDVLSRMRDVAVGVIGDYCLDGYWTLDTTRQELSVETWLPVNVVKSHRYSLGGASNVVANLAAIGVGRIQSFAVLGNDVFGREMLDQLGALGADCAGVVIQRENWDTTVFAKPHVVDEEQQRYDFGTYNAISPESEKDLIANLEGAMGGLNALIINQQVPCGYHSEAVIAELNRLAKAYPDCVVVIDSRDKSHLFENVVFKMNAIEAARVCGEKRDVKRAISIEDIERYAAEIYERSGKPVVVTRGNRGMIVYDGRTSTFIPGIQTLGKIDPVGSGDTTTSALAASLAAGASIEEAARLSNFAAVVTIQKLRQCGTASPKEIVAVGANADYVYHPELSEDIRRAQYLDCLLYTSPSPRDGLLSRMPSSA